MATVDKNFRVKNGLVVEGTTAKVDGKDVLLDGDSTDLLVEGETNLFYTDDRVKDVLVDAVQENIVITKEDGVLTIAAENGVEDSTTDDLDEGTENLYFTDQRALDATSSAYDPAGSAATAESNANSYTDSAIGALDTDDIPEGFNNLYHTDERVRDAVSAGDGLDFDGQTGEFSVVTGDGLEIDGNDAVAVDAGEGLGFGEAGELLVDTDLIATVAYVNATAEGLHVHTAVAVATTENIADLSSPPSSIDGVTLTEGMRVLVKDQTDKSENGIYVVDSGELVRAEDHDTSEKVRSGDFVFVTNGTTQAATGYVQINDVNTLGTDPLEWAQFIGAGVFTAGAGLDLTGNVFSLDADTDDVPEGSTNLYYTDQRVEDVIANSDTDDIAEGATNLYFTDQRAVDALEAVTPNFTEIEINNVSKQVAASIFVDSDTGGFTAYSFDPAEYRSAKFLVKAAFGSHTQISEILLTLDTSDNISITEYAIVTTNDILIDISADQSGGQILLIVNAENANTTVTVFGTLIK
jgi:hypothetical protein